MSTVIAKTKDGKITHFIDCRYTEKGDKFVVIHDEQDLKHGGLMPSIQKVYDKSELESIKED